VGSFQASVYSTFFTVGIFLIIENNFCSNGKKSKDLKSGTYYNDLLNPTCMIGKFWKKIFCLYEVMMESRNREESRIGRTIKVMQNNLMERRETRNSEVCMTAKFTRMGTTVGSSTSVLAPCMPVCT